MQEISITAGESSKKLENFLKKRFPIGYVRKLFRKHGVRLNGKRSKPDDVVAPGDCIQLYIPFEQSPPLARQNPTLQADMDTIFEDDEIIVINKPAGIAVHEGKDVLKRHSILGMLEAKYRRQGVAPRLVHRLDKDTSGVLIAVKKETTARQFESLFSRRRSAPRSFGRSCRSTGRPPMRSSVSLVAMSMYWPSHSARHVSSKRRIRRSTFASLKPRSVSRWSAIRDRLNSVSPVLIACGIPWIDQRVGPMPPLACRRPRCRHGRG